MSDQNSATVAYRVPYADTDQMGVVYYANFFVYFERVRNEILRNLGYPYRQMEEDGLQLPILEAHCDYSQPARFDDALTLVGRMEVLSPVRLKASCQVLRDGELLCEGYTVHACYSAPRGKCVRLPKAIVAGTVPG